MVSLPSPLSSGTSDGGAQVPSNWPWMPLPLLSWTISSLICGLRENVASLQQFSFPRSFTTHCPCLFLDVSLSPEQARGESLISFGSLTFVSPPPFLPFFRGPLPRYSHSYFTFATLPDSFHVTLCCLCFPPLFLLPPFLFLLTSY